MGEQWTNILRGSLTLVLMVTLYVGIPALVITSVVKWRKRRKMAGTTRPKRKYKILSLPLIFLCAIPSCVLVLRENYVFQLERVSEDVVYLGMTVCFVVTMAVSLASCKLAGIWIGFLRFLLGTALGISVGTSIALFFSACLGLMCAAGLSENDTSSISFRTSGGTYVHLIPSGSRGHYYDADTHEVYRLLNDNWVINDRTGESFPIG